MPRVPASYTLHGDSGAWAEGTRLEQYGLDQGRQRACDPRSLALPGTPGQAADGSPCPREKWAGNSHKVGF